MVAEISAAFDEADALPDVTPNTETELNDLYQSYSQNENNIIEQSANVATKNIRLVDAVAEGLRQSMEQHPTLTLMGQDIAEYGGVFKDPLRKEEFLKYLSLIVSEENTPK